MRKIRYFLVIEEKIYKKMTENVRKFSVISKNYACLMMDVYCL